MYIYIWQFIKYFPLKHQPILAQSNSLSSIPCSDVYLLCLLWISHQCRRVAIIVQSWRPKGPPCPRSTIRFLAPGRKVISRPQVSICARWTSVAMNGELWAVGSRGNTSKSCGCSPMCYHVLSSWMIQIQTMQDDNICQHMHDVFASVSQFTPRQKHTPRRGALISLRSRLKTMATHQWLTLSGTNRSGESVLAVRWRCWTLVSLQNLTNKNKAFGAFHQWGYPKIDGL